MKILCPHCHKQYIIDENRLPADKTGIKMPCPSCKGLIEIALASDKGPGNSSDQTAGPKAPQDPKLKTGQELKKRIFSSLDDLPLMPQVAQKARKVVSDPKSSFSDLAMVIDTDQGIVTRVLKMANSPYYGMSGKISSVQHASVILGTKTLMEILTLACSSEILGSTLSGYDLDAGDLWKHSLATASGSQIIAKRLKPALAYDAFSAGLIHDVGKIILDPYVLERKEAFNTFAKDGTQSFLEAEKQILGFDHAELASEVCERWNIPSNIAKAIKYHHDPTLSNNDDLSYIVHMADAIAMMSGIGSGLDGMLYTMAENAMDVLRLNQEDLSIIMVEMVQYVEKTTQGS